MNIPFLRLGEGLKTLSRLDIEQYRDWKIDTIIIAREVERIQQGAFAQFKWIKKILFEAQSKCYEIQEQAFYQCYHLEHIVLPMKLQIIKEGAFTYCLSLKRITLYGNIQKIYTEAFMNCINLIGIDIHNANISIEDRVFHGCGSMKNFKLGQMMYQVRHIHNRIALYQRTHKFQDKIFCRAIDVEKIDKGQIIGKKFYFIWTEANFYQGYGENLHEALDEYNFELGHREVARELGELTPDSEINITQYRALTKDCKAGTEEFLISKNIPLDATMKISDVYAVSDGYGRSYLLEKIMQKGSKKNEQ